MAQETSEAPIKEQRAKELLESVIDTWSKRPPRDAARIGPFLQAIGEEWAKKPDLRFGQLISNFISAKGDPFNFEEEEFLKQFAEYINAHERSKINYKYKIAKIEN